MDAKTRCSGIAGLVRMLENKNRQNEPAPDATMLATLLLTHGAGRSSQP
jgi:hypothetical protein